MPLTLLLGCSLAAPVDVGKFVRLQLAGLGRYQSAPALFLEEERGGAVLPVPVPSDSVLAIEQALAPGRPAMLEVLLQAQAVSKRDGALFDNLPWQWSPSPQAKRDAFARFSGRGYPREGYASPYHLIVDVMRRDACADVACALIEDTAVLGGGVVVGGGLLLERRLPQASDSGAEYAMGAGPAALGDGRWWAASGDARDALPVVSEDALLCECTADEALGVAVALDGARCVLVERAVWEACRLPPAYNTQRGKLRIEVLPRTPADDAQQQQSASPSASAARPAAPLPWEITSADQLLGMGLQQKALSAVGAGLRLPRARDASDAALIALLEPLLDEAVRRELRIRRALESGDTAAAAALEAGTSRRGQLLAELRAAVADERYGEAAQLATQLRVESERRMDVTQDEGAYDRYVMMPLRRGPPDVAAWRLDVLRWRGGLMS
jgi:hypothetical protein